MPREIIEETRTIEQSVERLPQTAEEWREAREARGLSRTQLAHRCGLNAATVWRLESDGSVSGHIKRLVAAALGLDPWGRDPLADGKDA